MARVSSHARTVSFVLAALSLVACAETAPTASEAPAAANALPAEGPVPLVVPDHATIPEGPLGDAIRRGEQIVTRTRETLPDHVRNDLHCTSCHLQGGTVANAGPWVGITAVFPEFRPRNGRVNTIEQRINDCFERSMNGTALDPASEDMAAIVAYMTWLSQGVPIGREVEGRGFQRIANAPTPDRAHGQQLYAERCAMCHGENGEGRTGPDGGYQFPPLWGARAYNLGAGMARLDTAAAFVRWNMPLGQGGTMTDQEAYDVADYFIHGDRPLFARQGEDWPNGGRPRDARY
jgi:thiosulfate dehydrogenase